MLLNCIDVHFCYTVSLHIISIFFNFLIFFFLYIVFIHRTIAITPFQELNMCVCIYLWWPSLFVVVATFMLYKLAPIMFIL